MHEPILAGEALPAEVAAAAVLGSAGRSLTSPCSAAGVQLLPGPVVQAAAVSSP